MLTGSDEAANFLKHLVRIGSRNPWHAMLGEPLGCGAFAGTYEANEGDDFGVRLSRHRFIVTDIVAHACIRIWGGGILPGMSYERRETDNLPIRSPGEMGSRAYVAATVESEQRASISAVGRRLCKEALGEEVDVAVSDTEIRGLAQRLAAANDVAPEFYERLYLILVHGYDRAAELLSAAGSPVKPGSLRVWLSQNVDRSYKIVETAVPADIHTAYSTTPAQAQPVSVQPLPRPIGYVRPEDDDSSWQLRSLCAQTDHAIFFPEKGASPREAKRVCMECEVRSECLEYALENGERFGIWGGLSGRERRDLKKQRPKQ